MQHDAMQCGIASLAMICTYYGRETSIGELSKICFATSEGVSLKGLCDAAKKIGFNTVPGKVTIDSLCDENLPCILHWNQNHFVVLYKVKGNVFFIADPSKGMRKCSLEKIQKHWIGTTYKGQDKGIALFLEPNVSFQNKEKKEKAGLQSLDFLYRYVKQYRRYFTQIIIGLLLGCILQLVLPFLTQSIVDIGIKNNDIGFIWLILLGELMIVVGRTATDFIRRWLLLHISMRINISLVSDFFIKLLKLPMSFFDTKLMGDLLQRINDHSRIQSFLTNQVLSIVFSFLSFIVFGLVLFIYDKLIFCIFLIGSIIYGLWIGKFLNQRKVLDYELFEQQAKIRIKHINCSLLCKRLNFKTVSAADAGNGRILRQICLGYK